MTRQVRGPAWFAAGAAATLLLGGTYAATAAGGIPGSDGVFNACYDSGGNVKLVPAGTSCARGWTPTSWSQTGPAGLTGPAGPAGKDGADGAPGAPGADGKDGAAGADGDSAYQIWLTGGNQGSVADFLASLQGEPGQTGPAGPPGPKGDAGPALGSLDTLAGLPCRVGTPQEGVVVLTYSGTNPATAQLACSRLSGSGHIGVRVRVGDAVPEGQPGTVTLTDPTGRVLSWVTWDERGEALFGGLPDDFYWVRVDHVFGREWYYNKCGNANDSQEPPPESAIALRTQFDSAGSAVEVDISSCEP